MDSMVNRGQLCHVRLFSDSLSQLYGFGGNVPPEKILVGTKGFSEKALRVCYLSKQRKIGEESRTLAGDSPSTIKSVFLCL
ncbi:hypothetical protein ACOSP7_013825 [Xanthoceras sorbifolium]